MGAHWLVQIKESGGTRCNSSMDAVVLAMDREHYRKVFDAIIRDEDDEHKPKMLYLDGRWYSITPHVFNTEDRKNDGATRTT